VGADTIEWGKALEKAWKEHLDENPDAAQLKDKRPTNGSTFHSTSSAPGNKKIKMESTNTAMNEMEIRQLWQKDQLGKLTVAVLKDFCAMKNIPQTGKKADIVANVEAWLESKSG
jgi:hypothetical protein